MIFIIVSIFFIISFFIYSRNKLIQKMSSKYLLKQAELKKQYDSMKSMLDDNMEALNSNIKLKEKRLEELDSIYESKVDQMQENINREIEEWAQSAQEAANFQFTHKMDNLQILINETEREFQSITEELEKEKLNQEGINEAIKMRLMEKDQINMRSLQLTDEQKSDIKYLCSMAKNLTNSKILYKLIWSEYLQKPFQQMIKNIFGGSIPKNVIYCIENKETHQKYIGKTSGDVSNRWKEHIKTSLGIGAVSKSRIHEIIFCDWDNYIFYVLEEVNPGSSLSEKEKYYINFYDTVNYGYNMRNGG